MSTDLWLRGEWRTLATAVAVSFGISTLSIGSATASVDDAAKSAVAGSPAPTGVNNQAASTVPLDKLPEPKRRVPPPAPKPDPRVKEKKAAVAKPQVAAEVARSDDSIAVLDQLIAADSKRLERNRQDSQALFDQARQFEAAGRASEALRLARQAKTISAENPELAPFIARLQKSVSQKQSVNAPQLRARAHIAAALARANDLGAQRKYASQEDLLKGVIAACDLFKEPATVANYRKSAVDQLARLASVHNLKAIPRVAEDPTAPGRADALRLGYGVAAPENFRRILPVRDFEMPRWYRLQKAALAKPLNVDYRLAPVALVFDDLGERSGVQLLVDTPVSQSRAHLNATIDLKASDLPTETLLNIACAKSGLEYVILEKAIVITSPEKALEYARSLPEVIRNHWAAARMLFPDIDAALLASQSTESAAAEDGLSRSDLAAVPAYLVSGQALVEHIRALLK